MTTASGPVIDATTILSLSLTVVLLGLAYTLSLRVLPSTSTNRTRVLFIWHAFDSLIHFLLEGSFLWNCFTTYVNVTKPELLSALIDHAAGNLDGRHLLVTAPGVHFMGREDRLYGPAYGNSFFAKLWQVYAQADRRWGGADLGVVSLECLTVFIGAPLAAYVCYLLTCEGDVGPSKRLGGRVGFWMTVLATGELYGGERLLLSFSFS